MTHINEVERLFSPIQLRSKAIAVEPAVRILYLIFLQTEKTASFSITLFMLCSIFNYK